MNQCPESPPFEEWPPRDKQVPLALMVSHHAATHSEHIAEIDHMGPLTIGQHLVPLVDSVLKTVLSETAGRGAETAIFFDLLAADQPDMGAKLTIGYDGPGPSSEVFDDETSELGSLKQQATEAGGGLEMLHDSEGASVIELIFRFQPRQI